MVGYDENALPAIRAHDPEQVRWAMHPDLRQTEDDFVRNRRSRL
jgi:hypothetical protein